MAGKSFSVNNAAATSITFNPTIAIKDGFQYIDSSSTLATPRLAQVKHNIASLSSNMSSDRHYVQFTKTLFDANGAPYTASVAVSVVIPRSVVPASDTSDLRKFAANFVNTDAIWNGFVQGDY